MTLQKLLSGAVAAVIVSATATAQHAQVTCVAARPGTPNEVWTCNRDNNSVSVVNLALHGTVAQVATGNWPRSLAFSADGSKVFVACQRGNVAFNETFVTPFDGSEIRGQVTIIDAATRTVITTLNDVGVEPYGIALAPNGEYFAVTGFRSNTVKFFDAQTFAPVLTFDYLANINFIPPPFTIADVDANRDGLADVGEPRGFTIQSNSTRLYVTHHRSPYVSVLDLTLDLNGLPTAATMTSKIDTNEYPFDPFYNPTPVQTLQSQGVPRFGEDIALSPDASRALVPAVLHNLNHDVNFNFGPGLAGAFANRVYPALTMIDAVAMSYGQLGDNSRRLHNELSASNDPAATIPFGTATPNGGGIATLGIKGQPVPGNSITFVIDGLQPNQTAKIWYGRLTYQNLGSVGEKYVKPRFTFNVGPSGELTSFISPSPSVLGTSGYAQAAFFNSTTGVLERVSNGVEIFIGAQGYGLNKMGHRAGQPSRVQFDPSGTLAVMMNRGSEDLFLYTVNGSSMTLASVYPPRHNFQPRAPLSTSTPMGDLPLGFALIPNTSTSNDDAHLVVMNEATRTLSTLRINYKTRTIHPAGGQIPTLLGPDAFSTSVRIGEEAFEDASRPQTAGNFNNSCGSCHFEGGDDGNVWQRGNGPRATMPMYGGTLATGLVLWKGVRLNVGETGPMFGGENGGTGVFSNAEQQGLIDFHETIPVPLNPNLGLGGAYAAQAELGKDLFFGTNDTGLNPTNRAAGCATCHPDHDTATNSARGYTADFVDPSLTMGENLETVDEFCVVLQENIAQNANLRNVNSGCNIDQDLDTFPDLDRNSDGYSDLETYAVMNTDKDDDFLRDDPNSYLCPLDPQDPFGPQKQFGRNAKLFSVPTKLGVFSSGPYFHDHIAYSLRAVVDPEAQASDPVYGSPAYGFGPAFPGVQKFFNEFHDVRGHEAIVPGSSKVQITLQSTNVQADIEALLSYISSL
jgi:YVTN family beta-propeller protein